MFEIRHKDFHARRQLKSHSLPELMHDKKASENTTVSLAFNQTCAKRPLRSVLKRFCKYLFADDTG
jgi:hypothetical protein